MPDIFTPLQIKSKELKNRIVMGAAERVGFTYEDGLMGEDVIQEYEACETDISQRPWFSIHKQNLSNQAYESGYDAVSVPGRALY